MKVKTLTKTIEGDLYTPVGLYYKLRDLYPQTILLESNDYHNRSDSKSFICLDSIAHFEAKNLDVIIKLPNEKAQLTKVNQPQEVLELFKVFIHQLNIETSSLPFECCGLWGYNSFESLRYFEEIETSQKEAKNKGIPDMRYDLYRQVVVFDHFTDQLHLIQHFTENEQVDETELDKFALKLRRSFTPHFSFSLVGETTSNFTDDEYKSLVGKGINHCLKGDTFQLVLSRHFQQNYQGDEFNLYRALRSVSPSPYLFYFDFGDFKILGSSPEAQLVASNNQVSIHPIAGTVRRGSNSAEDKSKAKALKHNEKEMAEHVMLVDLARNDLSKSCETVNVENFAEIQYFSHVIHLVSKVSGHLQHDKSALDVFTDTFPAGTLSGAPKYRAIQLIDQYENVPRSFYGGSIGFITASGTMNQAIIIRSALCKDKTITYQAGAGIVADSTPEGECQEVYNKVAAIQKALKKAEQI